MCTDCAMTCPLCLCEVETALTPVLFLPKGGGRPVAYWLCRQCNARAQQASGEERLGLLALIEAALEGVEKH